MSERSKIYVGNLPNDIRERDLEDMFYKYGKIIEVDLHTRKGVPFAFLEFEDPRDAEDAIRGKDGYMFDSCRLRVEYPRGSKGNYGGDRDRGGGSYRGYGDRGRGGGYRGDRGRGGRGGYQRKPRGYQLSISGLPPTGSWQDIKDHFRQAGDVIYADVNGDGSGVVEFLRREHAKRAQRDLDDSKFKSHEGESAYIRVKDGYRSRSRSYSPKRSRSRSPRRSPRYSRSRSRSRSYSPAPAKSPRSSD